MVKDMYMVLALVSAISIIAGVCFFYCVYRKKHEKIYYAFSGCCFLVIPVLVIAGDIVHSSKLMMIGLVPAGLFFLATAIQNLKVLKNCNLEIKAEYVSAKKVRGYRGRHQYSPVFSYYYNGESFTEHCMFQCHEDRIIKYYVKGGEYKIYINPENPHQCIEERTVDSKFFLLIIVAVIVIFLGIFGGPLLEESVFFQ